MDADTKDARRKSNIVIFDGDKEIRSRTSSFDSDSSGRDHMYSSAFLKQDSSLGRFESWIGNPIFADLLFVVGAERTKIPAHRIVLAVSDSIFKEFLISDDFVTLISALASSAGSAFSFSTSSSTFESSSSPNSKSNPINGSQSHKELVASKSNASSNNHVEKKPVITTTSTATTSNANRSISEGNHVKLENRSTSTPVTPTFRIEATSKTEISSPPPSNHASPRRVPMDAMMPIILEDIKAEIFMQLLSYLYCNKLTLHLDIAADYNFILDLLDLSDRFRVISLSHLLIQFLETDENAITMIGPELISQLKTKLLSYSNSSSSGYISSLSQSSPNLLINSTSSTPLSTSGFHNGRRPSISRSFASLNPLISNSAISLNSSPYSSINNSNSSLHFPSSVESSSSINSDYEAFEENENSIQYNITDRSVQFSDTIKRRIAVAKLRIEEQARKMKADNEELDWLISKPELLPCRANHTASSYGNALVIIGGQDGNSNGVGKGVEFLIEPHNQPGSLIWTETKKTGVGPRSIHAHATCRVGSKFYSYGGIVDGERSSKMYITTVINDDTVHWSIPRLTGDLPPALIHHSILRHDKNLILFGGFDGTQAISDVWNFDTDTNKWKKEIPGQGTLCLPRYGHCAVIIGSKMLVLGGHDHLGNYFNDLLAFDLTSKAWCVIPIKATVPRMAYHSAVRIGRNILVYGGRRKSGGLIKELWKLNILDEQLQGEILWTKVRCNSNAPHERYGHTVNRIGSKIFVIGGLSERGKPFGDICEANTVKLPLEKARLIDHSELEISSLVGMGNFSQVRRGLWNNNVIAIKLIKSHTSKNDQTAAPKNKNKAIKDFKAEVELLSQLKHPNLVNFLGYCIDPNAIVMEYLPQNLHDYLVENRGKLDKQQLQDLAYDIARGMEYLHSNSIIHRDLKSFNILLDENLNVKIADFGIARVKSNTSTMTTTGTIAWTAPEILRHESYNEKSDVYSFAIVLWEMVSEGEIPFDEFPSPMEAGIAVATGQLRPAIPSGTDQDWAALIEKCWREDPSIRPSFTDIMDQIKKFE